MTEYGLVLSWREITVACPIARIEAGAIENPSGFTNRYSSLCSGDVNLSMLFRCADVRGEEEILSEIACRQGQVLIGIALWCAFP